MPPRGGTCPEERLCEVPSAGTAAECSQKQRLADSGQIERDADDVLLLHRDRAKDLSNASLIIAK